MIGAFGRLAGWVAATLAGIFLAAALAQGARVAIDRLPNFVDGRLSDAVILVTAVATLAAIVMPGFLLGAAQALALPPPSRHVRAMAAWAVATGVGAWFAGGLGIAIALLLGDFGEVTPGFAATTIGGGVGGAVLGMAQATLLPAGRRLGWVAAGAAGGLAFGLLYGLAEGIGWALVLRLAGRLGRVALAERLMPLYWIGATVAAAVPFALATGSALVRMAAAGGAVAPPVGLVRPGPVFLTLLGATALLVGGTCLAIQSLSPPPASDPNAPPWPPARAGTWETIVGDSPPNRPADLALDAVGNVYVADAGRHRVYKLSPSLQPIAEWGRLGPGPGALNTPEGIAVDAQGNVYVSEGFNFRVQRFDPRGQSTGTWGGPEGFQPAGLAFDGQGNLLVADMGSHAIARLRPADGPSARWTDVIRGPGDRRITSPRGLAVDRDGTIFVAEPSQNRVRKVGAGGQDLALWALTEDHPAEWIGPSGIAVDGRGVLHVADGGSNRIVRIDRDGRVLGEIGPSAALEGPVAVAVDPFGDLYVAEADAFRVRKLAADGRQLATWGEGPPLVEARGLAVDGAGNLYAADARRGDVVRLAPDGRVLGRLGRVEDPVGMVVDRDGALYVADGRNRVQKLAADGRVLASRAFRAPAAVAVAPDGSLFVADRAGGRVLRRGPDGGQLDPLARPGRGPGELAGPVSLAVDDAGNVYVGESGRADLDGGRGGWPRVQKLSPSGQPLASWSVIGGDSMAGPEPVGIALAPDGGVYVALSYDPHLVRLSERLEPIATYPGPGDELGILTGIAVDRQGRVYVADHEGRIKRLTPG